MTGERNGAGEDPGSFRLEEEVGALLRGRGLRLAVAESCTGGMLGGRLTSAAGSSAYFVGGVIAYADEVKREVLGVPAGVLRERGAVSRECAAALATRAGELLGAEVSVSVTGIAGPGGGSPEKPVGLVYVGLAGPWGVEVQELRLAGSRDEIRRATVDRALILLRARLAPPGPPDTD